mgnify:CR=1 FL=1
MKEATVDYATRLSAETQLLDMRRSLDGEEVQEVIRRNFLYVRPEIKTKVNGVLLALSEDLYKTYQSQKDRDQKPDVGLILMFDAVKTINENGFKV